MSLKVNISPEEALSYRTPMKVCNVCVHHDDTAFAVCPRCDSCMEYDYQNFCNCCGQALNWRGYSKACVLCR